MFSQKNRVIITSALITIVGCNNDLVFELKPGVVEPSCLYTGSLPLSKSSDLPSESDVLALLTDEVMPTSILWDTLEGRTWAGESSDVTFSFIRTTAPATLLTITQNPNSDGACQSIDELLEIPVAVTVDIVGESGSMSTVLNGTFRTPEADLDSIMMSFEEVVSLEIDSVWENDIENFISGYGEHMTSSEHSAMIFSDASGYVWPEAEFHLNSTSSQAIILSMFGTLQL